MAVTVARLGLLGPWPPIRRLPAPDDVGSFGLPFLASWEAHPWSSELPLASESFGLPQLSGHQFHFSNRNQYLGDPAVYVDASAFVPGWNDFNDGFGSVTPPYSSVWLPPCFFGRKGCPLRAPKLAFVGNAIVGGTGGPQAAFRAAINEFLPALGAKGVTVVFEGNVGDQARYVQSMFPFDVATADVVVGGPGNYYSPTPGNWLGGQSIYQLLGFSADYAFLDGGGNAQPQAAFAAAEAASWASMVSRYETLRGYMTLTGLPDEGSLGAVGLVTAGTMAAGMPGFAVEGGAAILDDAAVAAWAAGTVARINAFFGI